MSIWSILFITFGGLFVATFRSQAKVQGGATLNDLLGINNNNNGVPDAKNGRYYMKNLLDIYGTPPPVQSTLSPYVPTSGGIPGVGSCTCVPYYLCINGSINTNGENLIDIRTNNGPCGNNLEVCCSLDNISREPITSAPPAQKKTGCGFRHKDGMQFRIIGKENEAQFGEFPWMVAVLTKVTDEDTGIKLDIYHCGGALIHPQMVVTAAHYFKDKNKFYKIRAGEWDSLHTGEILPHQDREVQHIVVHPEYYAGALYNDVALLYLKSPLKKAAHIGTICLPPQGLISNTGLCYATGWGKDVFGKKGEYQDVLKKIDVPVVPNAECQEKLRTTRLGRFFELDRSFMCAGGERGKDTCKGDGGSPLVCPIIGERDRYYQAGIVAWGIGCGDDIPGVYVNLPLYRVWIDSQVKSFGLDSSYYEY